MNKTSIEWVRNPDGTQGYTWNPITGCNNQIDGMCQGGNFPCYAYKLANGRLADRYKANHNIAGNTEGKCAHTPDELIQRIHTPFYPRFWLGRLGDIPHDWTTLAGKQHVKPRGIFVCDMSDLFGIGVPEDWTRQVIEQIKKFTYHRFYLLTKQPQNLIKWSPFPGNCYVGITCTTTAMFAQSLIKAQGMKATVKFISFEPLLEWNWNNIYQEPLELVLKAEGINWVIIGAQTKPYKPPEIEWVREIVEAADKAGIPVFLKDNLEPLLKDGNMPCCYSHRSIYGWELRQEMPE